MEENYFLFFKEPMKKTDVEPMADQAPVVVADSEVFIEPAPPIDKKKEKKEKKKEKKGKGKKDKKKEKSEEELVEAVELAVVPAMEESTHNFLRDSVWIPYIKNLDEEIREMIMVAIDTSLFLFLKEMGNTSPVTPFFELLLELHDPDIIFVPSADIEDPVNFHTFVSGLLDDIFNMGKYMDRVDPDETTSYNQIAKQEEDIRLKYTEICSRVLTGMEKALAFTKEFDEYIMLWVEDRQEFLRQFLTYSRLLTLEEMEQLKDENGPGIKESPPTVSQFKDQIGYYENLYKKVEQIPSEHILMDGWLRVDVKPLRQAILNTICKWGNMFKQHLFNHVIDSLNGLENFIKESVSAMQVPLAEDDYDGLLKVMGYLFKVKERQVETDVMFEPLKEIMELLKDYSVEFPEEIYVQLQEIPDRWIQCKKVILHSINTYFFSLTNKIT